MANSLSFFRVFDLAFFAPGMLLFGALWYSGCFPGDELSLPDDTVHRILSGAFAVMLIYLLGLICHGIQRAVYSLININNVVVPPFYANLQKDIPRHELSLYFWYLSSTCWNLAVAIVLGVITGYIQNKLFLSLSVIAITVFVTGLLVFIGWEFNESKLKAKN